ncbi:MAG TPA: hypothetical protein VK463_08150 [Desulfomonilaceae bacterium]|nr:hypothetical protein [Desulfomonilaceae bacterium]
MPASHVAISLTGFIVLYSLLGLVAFALMVTIAKKGPAQPLPEGPSDRRREIHA